MGRNRSKENGTRYERQTRQQLSRVGLQSRRLAEEGLHDQGDLELPELGLVIECRWRENLSAHPALALARSKAQGGGHRDAILAWKRSLPVGDQGRRAPVAGQSEVWMVDRDLMLWLLSCATMVAGGLEPGET